MTTSYGTGLTRVLPATDRQFDVVVWQQDMPPLDSEHVLQNHLANEKVREHVRSLMYSGFLLDPTIAMADYAFDPMWSNFFVLGNTRAGETQPVLWANVNGWILPIAGTQLAGVANHVRLNPPPATNNRIDMVFLEVWRALVSANPSTVNKPSASTVWKYGNVEYGDTNPADDLTDPDVGFETTKRVQLQYRIRVHGAGAGGGTGVALDVYPDGLGDPNILGQGTATAPVGGPVGLFSNMRETLGDPSLWRAGDGDSNNGLGTVDGYVYAIPICAVFRRNASAFVAINSSGGNPNQNGGFNRNTAASLLVDPRDGAKILTSATLDADLLHTFTGVVNVTGLTGSGLDDTQIPALIVSGLYLWIGTELVKVSAVGANTVTISVRGCWGTSATRHAAGSAFGFFNTRPDGLFSDQIAVTDILDLRRAVNPGNWDYQRLLEHNLGKLLSGQLQSSWKRSGPGDTIGPYVVETDWLHAVGTIAAPNQTVPLDGPDGIRTIWSDAAVCQSGVTVLCDPDVPLINGYANSLDITVGWDVGADFQAQGFINNANTAGEWTNGSTIFLFLGGADNGSGARATFRDGNTRAVRFVMPYESITSFSPYLTSDWSATGSQTPVTAKFLNSYAMEPGADGEVFVPVQETVLPYGHPGPMYPYPAGEYQKPFMVLGGVLDPLFRKGITRAALLVGTDGDVDIEMGFNIDLFTSTVLGGRYDLDFLLNPLGNDSTGSRSGVYAVLYGDHEAGAQTNNGAFQVVGMGLTRGSPATAATRIRVRPVDSSFAAWVTTAGPYSLTVELRSVFSTVDDGGPATGPGAGPAALAIVLTDVGDAIGTPATGSHPWKYNALHEVVGAARNYSMTPAVRTSKLEISTTLLYSPGRGGTARLAEDLWRVALKNPLPNYLRQAKGVLDSTFANNTSMPLDETYFDPDHIQLWNRLSGKGVAAPVLPDAGGNLVSGAEQDREHELFVDKGSKTLVLRPFQDEAMTLAGIVTSPAVSLLGAVAYPVSLIPKDGLGLFTPAHTLAFALPPEFMPRLGRQDIPYHTDLNSGAGTFLSGINHLFRDSIDPTQLVFNIIGGDDNLGGNSVLQLHFQTGNERVYGDAGPTIGGVLNRPCYQARRSDTVSGLFGSLAYSVARQFQNVKSSDLGAGLEGIQFPPYLGIARLYGVYERQEWIDLGGNDFNTDRITPTPGAATNLLRTDVDQQTLFIMKDGARDITGTDPTNPEVGDHTYVIPSNVIDVTKARDYTGAPGFSDFKDFDYVVVATVFGFAKEFITENNYVLCRLHNGAGTDMTAVESGGSPGEAPAAALLQDIHMVIPAPASLNDMVYTGYSRTPYQGDPYGTRDGNTRNMGDYGLRSTPGQIPPTDSYGLTNQVQQFNPVTGADQLEIPNPRGFAVLASLDFYTTYGTGKIGGDLFEGTLTDTGYTERSFRSFLRVPETTLSVDPTTKIRAFSEGYLRTAGGASVYFTISTNTTGALVGADPVVFNIYRGAQLLATHEMTNGDVGADVSATLLNICGHFSGSTIFEAKNFGGYARFQAWPGGSWGNSLSLEVIRNVSGGSATGAVQIWGGDVNMLATSGSTYLHFSGGKDTPVNAGDGTSPIGLAGMTERLPLGILLQDSDFIGESPLNDTSSGMRAFYNGVDVPQTLLPLSSGGDEYSRFTATPGESLGMVDGAVLTYVAYDAAERPTGTKRFRLFRGGGACFMASGLKPGGPIEWVNGEFQTGQQPILKGGILSGKAILVRNYPEDAFAPTARVSEGDEIQMIILTSGVLAGADRYTRMVSGQDPADNQPGNLSISGIISPTGYGFGKTAADRYRLEGKPMFRVGARLGPDLSNISLAPAQTLQETYPGYV